MKTPAVDLQGLFSKFISLYLCRIFLPLSICFKIPVNNWKTQSHDRQDIKSKPCANHSGSRVV